MALDQPALLELVEMIRSAYDDKLIRRLPETIIQAFVNVEATVHIRALPHER